MLAADLESSRWGTVFARGRLAVAIAEGVVRHGGLVGFGGSSCRLEGSPSREAGAAPVPESEKPAR